ncbi:hypothetical protein PINS_up015079 [Pythium insidiosum]|nr:hypothetical protein PINS_up015079 [Pythium insidiosum]
MKLYVHYEEEPPHTSWTKRLTVDADSTTLAAVIAQFAAAFQLKFQRPLAPERRVLTELHQNAATRRVIAAERHALTLRQLGISIQCDGDGGDTSPTTSDARTAPCDVEIVVIGTPSRATARVSPAPETASSPSPSPSRSKSKSKRRNSKSIGRPSFPDLMAPLELAATQAKALNFRAAREIYETLVLRVDPTNAEALLALAQIFISIGRHDVAVNQYLKPCWEAHHDHPTDKTTARIAFNSGLKLAACQIKRRRFRAALKILDELQQFLRQQSKCRGFFSDAIEREQMETQMDILRAHALYDLKTPVEQETAISLLIHLLPDLQDPRVNLDALQLYARIAHERGKANDALSMLLRVLVGKADDKSVKKQLVALLRGKQGMERLLHAVPATTPSAAAAYAFVATILKDHSVLDTSAKCLELALSLRRMNAAYALNLAHVLVVNNRYQDAFEALTKFLSSNGALSVEGIVTASAFLDALCLEGIDILSPTPWSDCEEEVQPTWKLEWQEFSGEGTVRVFDQSTLISPELPAGTPKPVETYVESELDLLACFFTIIKILFVTGRLSCLPRLIALLEPVRHGRQLHKTIIRNEHAYYLCIAQLLCVSPQLTPRSFSDSQQSSIYVCGDSHTLATAWRNIEVDGESTQLRPALVTGLKHWHLRKESEFYPKHNFWTVIGSLPPRSRVIFLIGEIDCREGILQAYERCKYESIQEGMEHTIDIFMSVLAEVIDKFGFEVFIHPIVPVLNETRPLVIQYNGIFQSRVNKSDKCRWLDFFDDLIEGSPARLRPRYALDGTHLHPSYLALVERELNKAIAAQ